MVVETQHIHKILLIVVLRMGDAVMATPLTRALRNAFPHAQIDMLVSTLGEEVARHNPFVDKAIVYDVINLSKERSLFNEIVNGLQQEKYDLALATHHFPLHPMIAWLSGARYRLGFSTGGGAKFLTHIIPLTRNVVFHQTERLLTLLEPLGITTSDTSMSFDIFPEEVKSLQQKITIIHDKPIVLICPFSSCPQKDWTMSGWSSLIRSLSPIAHCFLLGGQEELLKIQRLAASSGNLAQILAGKLTLGESAALMAEADLFITVDTGPMHIAQAFPAPILALFGPTHPQDFGSRRSQDVALYRPQSSSPCRNKEDNWRYDECNNNHLCIENLAESDVIEAAMAILQTRRA